MYHCQNVCHVLFVKRPDYTGVDVNLLCFICNNQMATFLLIQPLVPLHVQGKKIVLHKYHPVNALLANFAQSYIKGGMWYFLVCVLDTVMRLLRLGAAVWLCQGNLCWMVRMYYFWQASEPIRQPHMWLSCSSTCLFPLESFCLLCWDVQGDMMEVYWRAWGADSSHEEPRPVPVWPVNILLCK